MECVQSEQAYKWLRSDGGWSTGRLYCAIGKVVTSWGLKAVGIELKPSYYKQAEKNLESASLQRNRVESMLFDEVPA